MRHYKISDVKITNRLITLVVICLVTICTAAVLLSAYLHDDSPDRKAAEKVAQQPRLSSVSSNLLIFGNVYWGRYINDWSMASELKYAYPFSRLNEFHREQYDAWIAGLECPTVAGIQIPSDVEDDTLQFNCSPDYLPEAAKWFTAFTLANNHTDNQGVEGFTETKTQLDKNGIQYFGHYDPDELTDLCEIISVPVNISYDDGSRKTGKLPLAMCGHHGVYKLPSAESADVIGQYARYLPVIALPHMGEEYKSVPDSLKTSFYHSLIDAGADVVLGDHPHWIQPAEAYKGHLIVYSLGNFIFDQQYNAEVTRSAAVSINIEAKASESGSLNEWLKIGESCAVFKDDCLLRAEQQKLAKLQVGFEFSIVGTSDDNHIAKPATAEQQAAIVSRLNWQTTITELLAPYSGR